MDETRESLLETFTNLIFHKIKVIQKEKQLFENYIRSFGFNKNISIKTKILRNCL